MIYKYSFCSLITTKFKDKNIIEIGCSLGYTTHALSGYFNKVTAVDYDPARIQSAKEFNKHKTQSLYQPSGTTILEAIQAAVDNEGAVKYDPWANNLFKGSTIVAVIGEYPYAEGYGDSPTISLSSFDKAVLDKCYKSGNQLVVVILSGRPLIIEKHIDNWGGLIAAGFLEWQEKGLLMYFSEIIIQLVNLATLGQWI